MGKATERKQSARRKGRADSIIATIIVDGTEIERLAAKRRRHEAAAANDAPLVNSFAAAQGIYREVEIVDEAGFVKPGKRGERVVRNFGATIVDRWLDQGGPGFEEPQRRAIDHCRALWRQAIGPGSMVANLDRVRGSDRGRSIGSIQEALVELGGYASRVPAGYWQIFENCVRWDEPAGQAGSRYASNAAQQIASAKMVIGFVASLIAMWERF